MKVYRTYDGRSFDINQPLSQFQSKEDLFDVISLTSGIPGDDIICMTQAGQQINDDVLEEMQETSAKIEQSDIEFFVFHRQFLYSDLEALVAELEEFPELEAHLEEPDIIHPPTPRSLTNLVDWCSLILSNITTHDAHSSERLHQLFIIQKSTTIALSNLLSHSASVRDTANTLESTANKELSRMKGLLNGHETDLKILSLVHINPKLLSVPDPSKGKPKERTLGDYVSPSKMGAVYQACNNVHNDLENNLRNLKFSETQMNEDTEGLRNEVQGTNITPSQETYEESRQALERARQVHDLIMSHCLPDDQGWSAAAELGNDEVTMKKVDEAIGELILLDEVVRESLRRLTADKNDMVSRSLHLLGDISGLQSDYADLGIELTQLDSEFKSSKIDGFRHLARLKNMLWAYGSTLVEIHRRKEFEDKFLIRSQALAEVMANLSENERKRRTDFRSQVMGALPWEVKGIDENTPNLEISAGKSRGEEEINIGRSDIDDLFQTLDFVEEKLLEQSSTTPIQEVKTALQHLVARLDEAEAEFVRLVEVGLLGKPEDDSVSEAESPNRYVRSSKTEFASQADKEKLEREFEYLKMQHGEKERALERAHDLEIATLRAEVSKLKADNRHLEYSLDHEKGQHEETRKQLESREADAEVEAARRINMEEEVSRLRKDCEDARRAEMESKAEANEEIERANDLEAHLHDLQIELEEAKDAKNDACHRIEALLDKDSSAEKQLSLAQERIDELSDQLSQARVEERKARDAQYDTETARDKLLRNYRAEADGDRAILEENLRSKNVEWQEIKEKLRRKEKEMGELSDNVKILQGQLTAADEAHEELVRQLESNRETCIEAEMAKRQADRSLEAVLEKARPLMGRLIELHNTMRDMPPLSSSSSRSTSSKSTKEVKPTPNPNGDDEVIKQKAIEKYQSAADSPDVDAILDLASSLSKASLLDSAITKLESLPTLVKKLNKAYKHLKDTSQKQQLLLREKITFRNFSLGDLALFLPTRNNSGKPWAAFNINFPHFFLNFSGRLENEQLRESLQNKEWIVARITKIESRVATTNKSGETKVEGNPFQLTEGVKFYLLEVEGWNNANSNLATLPRRKSTSTTLSNATTVANNNQTSPAPAPAIKRWDSSPNPARQAPSTSEAIRNALEDADDVPEVPEEPSLGSPDLSAARNRSTSMSDGANLSKSSPVTEIVRDNAATMTISRASSPSGIALSLRNRSSSSEVNKNMMRSANEIVEAGFTRWPTVSERQQQQSSSSNGTTSGIIMAKQSSSESSRRGIEKTTPAFGRRKKMGPSSALNGSFGTAMLQSRSNASPPSTQTRTGQQMIPIGVAEKSLLRTNGKVDDSPNPFSASPAPATTAPEMRDYFAARRQRTNSSLRPDPVETPKGEFATSHGSSVADEALNRRASSSSSILSTFKPIPLLGSPRVRASATLSPSTEVAQGQHTLGQHSVDDELHLASTSYSSESSSAGRYSASHTMTLPRQISARRLPYSSSVSSWTSNWTLGRKSGAKAGEQNNKFEEGPFPATSASQSLRKLADGKSK